MKRLASLALKLIAGAGTVFIAACYGVVYLGTRGRVVDSGTGAGIPGLDVGCMDGTDLIDSDTTDASGDFQMSVDCTELVVTDTDGAANGAYPETTVPVTADRVLIPLDPLP